MGTLSEIDRLYLNLLKNCLTREIFDESYCSIPINAKTPLRRIRSSIYKAIFNVLSPWHLALVHTNRPTGETMIGMGALNNLEQCAMEVLENRIPGDFCEAGVWRGGACIFMNAMLKVHHDMERIVWVADSFEGLPKPNDNLYPQDKGSTLWQQSLSVSLEDVKHNFSKYGLLNSQVKFLKGFFSETMPTAPINKLALLRIDGDMYESTIVTLRSLYPKLSAGGYVIIDDYGMIPACDKAISDYRSENKIKDELKVIGYHEGNPLGAYWKKT